MNAGLSNLELFTVHTRVGSSLIALINVVGFATEITVLPMLEAADLECMHYLMAM